MDGHACTLSAIYSICRVFLPGALQCVPFNSRSVSRVRLQRDFGTVLWARSLQRAKAGQGCAARTCARDRGGLGECHLSAPRARAPAAICWRCPGCGRGCLGCGRGEPGAPVPACTCHRTVEAGLRHGGGPLSALDYSGSKNSADGKVFWNPEGTELADPFLKGRTGLTRFSAPVGSVSSAAVVTAPSVSEPSSSRHPHLPWQGGDREGRLGLAPVQVRPHLLQEEPWEGRAVS